MEQRISLITLAVDDLPRAVQFYENMGWKAAQTGPGVAAFNMNGTVFGLYPWDSMAKDMGGFIKLRGRYPIGDRR